MKWYILINEKEEGPFSYNELKKDQRISPDTLIRKEHSTRFAPIHSYPELKKLFEEEGRSNDQEDALEEESYDTHSNTDTFIFSRSSGPFFDLLILIIIVIFLWVVAWIFK